MRLIAAFLLLSLPLFPQTVWPSAATAPSEASLTSFVSTANSTSANLASGATFTGVWEYVAYPSLMLTGKADQAGMLYIELSPDGVNVDSTIGGASGIPTVASVPFFHKIEVGGRYVRIRWTNSGASATTAFRLNTAYGQYAPLTANLGGSISQYADALVTRPLPFSIPLALGLISGYEGRDKFGRNPQIDSSVATYPEDVWAGGGLFTGQPATCPGETGEILSSDADDNGSGSGARTISITYLDDDYNEITETLTLAGATPSVTSGNLCRLYRARVLTAGATGSNEGTLTVRNTSTTANVYAVIPAGIAQTEIAPFTVPAGKTAVINRAEVTITRASGAAGSALVRFYVRPLGGVYSARKTYDITTGAVLIATYEGFTIPEKSDFLPRVDLVSDNGTAVTVEVGFTLVTN